MCNSPKMWLQVIVTQNATSVIGPLSSIAVVVQVMSSDDFSLLCVEVITVKVTAVQHLLPPIPTWSSQFQSPLVVVQCATGTPPATSSLAVNHRARHRHQPTTTNANKSIGYASHLFCVESMQKHKSSLSVVRSITQLLHASTQSTYRLQIIVMVARLPLQFLVVFKTIDLWFYTMVEKMQTSHL